MRYFISLALILNSCSLINSYQPLHVECNFDKMKVLEYTRVCERETFQTWQTCANQAERLFCNHTDWSTNNVEH
jgi:hypothetical protein